MAGLRYNHQRPCHLVGMWLKKAKDNTLTHNALVKKLNTHSATKPGKERVRGGETYDLKYESLEYRIPTMIWSLTKDKNHGGSVIEAVKRPDGTPWKYILHTPENMNDKGQNIVTTAQRAADAKARGEVFTPPDNWLSAPAEEVTVVPPEVEAETSAEAELLVVEDTQEESAETEEEAPKPSGRRAGRPRKVAVEEMESAAA